MMGEYLGEYRVTALTQALPPTPLPKSPHTSLYYTKPGQIPSGSLGHTPVLIYDFEIYLNYWQLIAR